MFRAEPVLFATGRQALFALLRALHVKPGEEIIVQGCTCIVVPNAIHAAGAVPVFADIDPTTLNLTPETVTPLITARTRAIICQHTFGIPADTKALKQLCEERGLLLIEDMAHILPDTKGPLDIGTHGDYLILSFGRDKAVSGISGGAVVSRHAGTTAELLEMERTAGHATWWSVMLTLEYATRMHTLIRPFAGTPLRKIIVKTLRVLGLIVPVVTREEKKGLMSPVVTKIPNACAALALYSLRKLPALNERRRMLTAFYLRHGQKKNWPVPLGIRPDMPLQKFPLFVHDAEEKRKMLTKENMHLDDGWTGCVICPADCSLESADYRWGSDPNAEAASSQIFSLPTHPTMTMYQAETLARRIDTLLEERK